MESANFICDGKEYLYSKGYIGLPVEVGELPVHIEVGKTQLQRKSTFHVSLVCVKEILKHKPNAEDVVLAEFCTFTKSHTISFLRFTGGFRLAEQEERKTLVALCEVSNLLAFRDRLSASLGIPIPTQPTHVTLYTLQPDAGIGLNSSTAMEELSVPVDVPEEVKRAIA